MSMGLRLNLNEGDGQVAYDSAGSHDGRLGSTTVPDNADPAWTGSTIAPELGPAISSVSYPAFVFSDAPAIASATISDVDRGGDGVASATLYYGYSWPFNEFSVAGAGPGGSGDGAWTFTIPAQGSGREGETLSFFIRFDVNENWLIKVEYQRNDGVANLNRIDNLNEDGVADFERYWDFVAAKMTFNF